MSEEYMEDIVISVPGASVTEEGKGIERVLLKLSGEALAGEKKTGFDDVTCYEVKQQGAVGRPRTVVSEVESVPAPAPSYETPVQNVAPQPVPQKVVQQPVQTMQPTTTSGLDSNAMLESLMS